MHVNFIKDGNYMCRRKFVNTGTENVFKKAVAVCVILNS